jgi:hypothetical protein
MRPTILQDLIEQVRLFWKPNLLIEIDIYYQKGNREMASREYQIALNIEQKRKPGEQSPVVLSE